MICLWSCYVCEDCPISPLDITSKNSWCTDGQKLSVLRNIFHVACCPLPKQEFATYQNLSIQFFCVQIISNLQHSVNPRPLCVLLPCKHHRSVLSSSCLVFLCLQYSLAEGFQIMWSLLHLLSILIFLSVEEAEAAKVTTNLTITVVDDGKLGRGQGCDETSEKAARPKSRNTTTE